MKFTLEFKCDNAMFDDNLQSAIAEILRRTANRMDLNIGIPVESFIENATLIRDTNGNSIGFFKLDKE